MIYENNSFQPLLVWPVGFMFTNNFAVLLTYRWNWWIVLSQCPPTIIAIPGQAVNNDLAAHPYDCSCRASL